MTYPHTNSFGVGVNPHHKKRKKFLAFLPQAALLAAILMFFLFSGSVLKSWSFKLIDFLAPERKELEKSRDQLLMLTKVRSLEYENKKLNELLGRSEGKKVIPLALSFGGGYLFLDTFFLKGGEGSAKVGDWVLKDEIFLGKIVEAGEDFAKFKSLGSLGERSTLRGGENKDIVFEASGTGGGELKAELPSSFLTFKVGDPIWWGEDPRYLAGLVESIRSRETSPVAEVIILAPLKIENLPTVEVLIR